MHEIQGGNSFILGISQWKFILSYKVDQSTCMGLRHGIWWYTV